MSETPPTKELAPIHDFGAKLRQPALIQRLKEYIRWQADLRADPGTAAPAPDHGPVSINLDLTTSCNYACDHCVDMDILNTGIRHADGDLFGSLELMYQKGLRSVILIGGGEPTVDPRFADVVRFLKERDVHVAVVSNGSGMRHVAKVAHLFGPTDWVRLSLDSGSDPTFQAMHKPKKSITLEGICEEVKQVKEAYPNLRMGFSFIVTWKGAFTNDSLIIENLHEIVAATKLARDHLFDYISIKPFLVRSPENNAEIVGVDEGESYFDQTIARIRTEVDQAKELQTEHFEVVESTNLRVLENRTYKEYTQQPRNCHMTFFRQVYSPLGIYNCPVYRHVPQAKLGEKDVYATGEGFAGLRATLGEQVSGFDASHECREVTCLYNAANWYLEDLIEHPEKLETLDASENREDYFL